MDRCCENCSLQGDGSEYWHLSDFNQVFLWSNRLQFIWVQRSVCLSFVLCQKFKITLSKIHGIEEAGKLKLSELEYLLPFLNYWDAGSILKRAGRCIAQSTGALSPSGTVAGRQAGYYPQIRYVCLGTWIAPLRLMAGKMGAKRVICQVS